MSESQNHSKRPKSDTESNDEAEKSNNKPASSSMKPTDTAEVKMAKGKDTARKSSFSKSRSSALPRDKIADFASMSQPVSSNLDTSTQYFDAASVEQPRALYIPESSVPGSYAYSWFQYQLYNYYVAAAAVAAASGNPALISPMSLPSPVDHRLADQYFSSQGISDNNSSNLGHPYHQTLPSQHLPHHSPTNSSSHEMPLHEYPSPVDFANYAEYAPYFYNYPYSASLATQSGERPSMIPTGFGQFPASPKMGSGKYSDQRGYFVGKRGSDILHNTGGQHFMSSHSDVSHLKNSLANLSTLDTSGGRRESFTNNTSPDTPLSASNQYSFFYPRGPPKKPPQSGYALWVGNLPSGSTLDELLQLFGTENIQSIFLIERTNCAFVNYLNQSSVDSALEIIARKGPKIRDNSLVVKRQEKDAGAESASSTTQDQFSKSTVSHEDFKSASFKKPPSFPSSTISEDEAVPENRYFICKSLTHEDLQASAAIGVWATQSQNVQKFNDAFKNCKNVYIFFSVNRAGNFFGYARMESEIADAPYTHSNPDLERADHRNKSIPSFNQEISSSSSAKPFRHHQQSNNRYSLDPRRSHAMPVITLTPANEDLRIPAGRIVDDSSRGFLFWEKISDRSVAAEEAESTSFSNWTASFRIKWLSTPGKVLPFTKTKHLRNAYNDNKPVKVAKDGTEIDPIVGQQLVELFSL